MMNLLDCHFALLVSFLLIQTTTGRLYERDDIMMGDGSNGPSCGEDDKVFSMLSTEVKDNKGQWDKFSPKCYTFTLSRDSRSVADDAPAVPIQVKVINGHVVSTTPLTRENSENHHAAHAHTTTMDSLYGIVMNKCVDGCASGSTYKCKVTYGEHGVIEQINVDQQNYIADEDLSYFSLYQTEFKVSNFSTCNNSEIDNAPSLQAQQPALSAIPAVIVDERRLRKA
jgi:Family of unknown function (DUF6174)